jgi:hypothetical protein
MSETDFYIGYKASAPPVLARFVRRAVAALLLGGLALAVALAALQKPFDPGHFEYGVVRELSGLLLESPVPTLVVTNPGEAGVELPSPSRFLLVSPGKFGAADLVAGLHGRTIQVRGSLIHRDEETMIELLPGSIRQVATTPDPPPATAIDLGEHTLVGEIVDSKCYLGVMKPGREKTHRACAVRCISGGIPPILRITGTEGEPTHLLLIGKGGASITAQILDFVAEPVEISGTIQRHDGQLALLIDPGSIRRLHR